MWYYIGSTSIWFPYNRSERFEDLNQPSPRPTSFTDARAANGVPAGVTGSSVYRYHRETKTPWALLVCSGGGGTDGDVDGVKGRPWLRG